MAAPIATYYDVLSVDRCATQDGIRRAYRKLAQQYHPDRMPDNANAGRAMAAINAAYDVLSDSHRRAEHDRWIRSASGAGSRPVRVRPLQSKWSTVWPWYLLFLTMAFALAAILTVMLAGTIHPRRMAAADCVEAQATAVGCRHDSRFLSVS
ncbi:J domain-containing protein [Ramlibacter sp.]|uniref:J domain-containing protein n=1 Tax=Ramlibacter sp. TaxID=1917967 RepID=UPI003D0F07F4